jgi:hypothetical protein
MPPIDAQNQYVGLPKRDLLALKRLHKNEPEMLPLIEAALKAAEPPYKAGRLSGEDFLDLAGILLTCQEQLGAADGAPTPARAKALSGIKRAVALVEKFRAPEPGQGAAGAGQG